MWRCSDLRYLGLLLVEALLNLFLEVYGQPEFY